MKKKSSVAKVIRCQQTITYLSSIYCRCSTLFIRDAVKNKDIVHLPMLQLKNYINGSLVEPVSKKYIDNYEPATGKAYSLCPDSDEQDVERAYRAAEAAFVSWSNTPAEKRSEILLRLSNLMQRDLDKLAKAETIDQGKPLWLSTNGEIPRAIKNIHFFATAIEHYASESHAMGNHAINYTVRNPIGVVGCISPWNLPLYLFTWKIAPALASGNCVVAKPSEITPMTAFLFSELCIEAGLPPGVLNIVHGLGHKVGAAITSLPGIKAISFTGGTKTGADIARTAAPMFKKLSLELGGKNPNIIFADCDFDKMLNETVRSSFLNQGEICLCGSRIFIERPIYEKFKKAFVEKVKKELIVGDPLEANTKTGAIVSEAHFQKVLSYIQLAKQEGGTVLTGGNTLQIHGRCSQGWFIEPTVIEGLPHTCRTNQEEIFGPVVTLTPFDTEEEVLQMANSTEYGLASILWTENITRANHMALNLKSGIVWVNCWLLRDLRTPFGGVKNSGVGREGGWEALRFFTEPKNICVKL